MRPLLVHKRPRIGQHAVVKLRVIPGHDDGARTARTAAHRRPALRIFRQLHMALRFDERQHLFLDEFRVQARHGVVFQAALTALGVAAAIADGNGDHHRYAMLGDEVIQRGKQRSIGTVRSDDKGRRRAGNVLLGDVNGDSPRVRSGMARGHHQVGGVGGVDRSRRVRLARDAGIDLAVGGFHDEVVHRTLRHALVRSLPGAACASDR